MVVTVSAGWRPRAQSEAFLSADLREVDAVEVNFGNLLLLTGRRMARDPSGLTLTLRWRALGRSTRPWCCFAHVVAAEKQLSSLDHAILRGRPPMSRWEPDDEGYERVRLWLKNPPDDVTVRLGIYDPKINVRAAVLASTLPVTDECSAVWIDGKSEALSGYVVRFDPAPLTPCTVVFEDGFELAAYSIVRHDQLVWLRLKWCLQRGARRGVRFFGHLIPEQAPEIPALAQFDQDVPVEETGPVTAVEQHIVRAVGRSGAPWLRVGLFRPSSLKRLSIRQATAAVDERHRCAYLEMPPR